MVELRADLKLDDIKGAIYIRNMVESLILKLLTPIRNKLRNMLIFDGSKNE